MQKLFIIESTNELLSCANRIREDKDTFPMMNEDAFLEFGEDNTTVQLQGDPLFRLSPDVIPEDVIDALAVQCGFKKAIFT